MDSSLVIKAKYGDTLRRFNAPVNENGQLDLDMNGLKEKICGLFNFTVDADLSLTYVDEDGDVVTLVDDNDLCDVTRQNLKFLKISVQLNNDNKSTRSYAKSSGSSTPLRSPRVQNPLPTGIDDILRAVPEPLREAFSKLSLDLTSKASSLNPVLGELAECISKMGQPLLNSAQQGHTAANLSTKGTSDIPMPGPGQANQSDCRASGLLDALPVRCVDFKEENGTKGGVSPVTHAPVDLNAVPSSDANPLRFTRVNLKQCLPPGFRAGDDKKRTREQNDSNQSLSSSTLASTSRATPVIPLGNECPFSGMSVASDSTVPPVVFPINSSRRTLPQGDSSAVVFHRGVQCDGCGAHPIIGPRYKSKVKHDYDLCDICFAEMGNEADYIKMDRPVTHRHLRPFMGSFAKPRIIHPPGHLPIPRAMRHCGMRSAGSKLDSRFIVDVNVLDGTMMAPSTAFTKIWRMRNSGTVAWPQGVKLVWTGGDRFSRSDSVELEIPQDGLLVGREIDVAVDFISPELPGRYISYWKMTSPSGIKFGQRVWVLIQVDASLQDPQHENFQGLNLNLPPDCDGPKFSETVYRVDPPVVDVGHVGPYNSVPVSEPVNPVTDEQAKEQDLNFPINNNLLVGNGVSAPPLPQTSSPISYPIIDLSEIPAPTVEEVPFVDVPASSDGGTKLDDDVERTLLKELEEMGFKQIDLNKEILRKNEYDLEQSVDDLCGVVEWDPILEELQEMGFSDKEMNKKLLQKNNGSIKRVVMDLLSGEEA